MSDNVTNLNTGYEPKIEPVQELKLPIELKNHKGETIASIYYVNENKKYYGSVNGKHFDYYGSGYTEFTDLLRDIFSYLYGEMHEHRKTAEKYFKLRELLKETVR